MTSSICFTQHFFSCGIPAAVPSCSLSPVPLHSILRVTLWSCLPWMTTTSHHPGSSYFSRFLFLADFSFAIIQKQWLHNLQSSRGPSPASRKGHVGPLGTCPFSSPCLCTCQPPQKASVLFHWNQNTEGSLDGENVSVFIFRIVQNGMEQLLSQTRGHRPPLSQHCLESVPSQTKASLVLCKSCESTDSLVYFNSTEKLIFSLALLFHFHWLIHCYHFLPSSEQVLGFDCHVVSDTKEHL